MDWMPPENSGAAGSSRHPGIAQPVAYEVCVQCYQPGTEIVTQELMGSAPADAFVVGSTPDNLGAIQMNASSWTLVHWRCNICKSSWYSYILYAQAYDCRIDDPLYSPRAIAQRSRANSVQYSTASTPHRGSVYSGGNVMTPAEQSTLLISSSEEQAPLTGTSTSFFSSQPFMSSTTSHVDDSNIQSALIGQDWTLYDRDTDSQSTWSPLGVPPGESRIRANSDARHKRGPHFDPQGYRRTRDRGACEIHKRNKKACRHPEDEEQ